MSIVASPTLSSDVRHKATSLLRQMYSAYNTDKAASASASKTGTEEKSGQVDANASAGQGKGKGLAATAAAAAAVDPNAPPVPGQTSTPDQIQQEPGLPTFIPPDLSHIDPATQAEARSLESQLDQNNLDDRVEDTPVSTDEVLRVHGIYMNQRRHFEIRVDASGKLVLWDADEGKVWGT